MSLRAKDLLIGYKKSLYSAAVPASGPLTVELTTAQELTTADWAM